MGLGKTLTMIALVAATDRDIIKVVPTPQMGLDQDDVHVAFATLIVVPPPRMLDIVFHTYMLT